MYSVKLNGRELTPLEDFSYEKYPDLDYATLTLNGEKFGIYIKKEDKDRFIKSMKGK